LSSRRVRQLEEYVRDNLAERLSLAAMRVSSASASGIFCAHLSRPPE
jgi:hypothetical protein